MTKNLLLIYYSQSGQLEEIARSVTLTLVDHESVQVDTYKITPEHDFPFPWNGPDFFGAFPESFGQIPQNIAAPEQHILDKHYDLILLCYQVWYLSPSIPINSFLKSDFAKVLLKNRPIVTISGSRNMWALAQEKVKVLLRQNGAQLVGNIALTDRHPNLVSVVSIVDWMFSGIKRKALGIFPLPGVSDEEIRDSKKFGDIILPKLLAGNYEKLQDELIKNNAVEIRFFLISMDKKGNRLFKIWCKLILKNPKKRNFLLRCFKYYLVFVIYFISPIVHLIELLLYPIRYFSIQKQQKYFQRLD